MHPRRLPAAQTAVTNASVTSSVVSYAKPRGQRRIRLMDAVSKKRVHRLRDGRALPPDYTASILTWATDSEVR